MTSKEIFLNFVNETQNKPYFSTLYDLDMWREDRDKIANDLEVLEIIKKYWSIGMNSSFQVSISYKPTSPMGLLPTDELLKLKEWLKND